MFALLVWLGLATGLRAGPEADEIRRTMRKAAEFFHGSVARHGGYVYYTSLDFSRRLGEGVAEESQIWVQPPATPSVGEAFLKAYLVTQDDLYLKAAMDAGRALLYGQLKSGGWTNAIDFDPKGNRAARYRNGKGQAKGRNFSTLDDDIGQSALRFLMQLDQATGFENEAIHEGARVGLEALLKAQFPNGAFPQGWDETPATPEIEKGLRGNFPDHDWRTEGRIKEYWDQYNLNDDIAPTVAKTLILAHRIYRREDCLEALRALGRFLIQAQMPEPQPAWAQQYNERMQPIWARRFEPPAIASHESQGVVEALMMISVYCRDREFLKPIPAALDYLKGSELADGRLARFYELRTNKPLYMKRTGKEYHLTHDDRNLPDHYGWKMSSRVDSLRAEYEHVLKFGKRPEKGESAGERLKKVVTVLKDLDEQGRWVSRYSGERLTGQAKFLEGEAYLSSAVFCRNLGVLSEGLAEE